MKLAHAASARGVGEPRLKTGGRDRPRSGARARAATHAGARGDVILLLAHADQRRDARLRRGDVTVRLRAQARVVPDLGDLFVLEPAPLGRDLALQPGKGVAVGRPLQLPLRDSAGSAKQEGGGALKKQPRRRVWLLLASSARALELAQLGFELAQLCVLGRGAADTVACDRGGGEPRSLHLTMLVFARRIYDAYVRRDARLRRGDVTAHAPRRDFTPSPRWPAPRRAQARDCQTIVWFKSSTKSAVIPTQRCAKSIGFSSAPCTFGRSLCSLRAWVL